MDMKRLKQEHDLAQTHKDMVATLLQSAIHWGNANSNNPNISTFDFDSHRRHVQMLSDIVDLDMKIDADIMALCNKVQSIIRR